MTQAAFPRTALTPRGGRALVALAVVATALLLALPLHGVRGTLNAVTGLVARPGHTATPFAGQLLVYGRHGLTTSEVSALRAAAPGQVTAVHGGELAVRGASPSYPTVPVEAFTVDAAAYARAAGVPSLRHQLESGIVLSRTGAALRHLGAGGHLLLDSGRVLPVIAVVEDRVLGGYELATTEAVLGHPAGSTASYLLLDSGTDSGQTARRLRTALPSRDLRVEARTVNGLMSSSDTVLTQAQIKADFGEFGVRTGTDGQLHLESSWEQRWIISTRIPQLGVVTCNRKVVGPLRAAMEEITRRGLGSLVHTADFQREGGCWNPRVQRLGGGQLSAHAWGIAVDINVDVNPLGATPHQDPRLVAVMAAHGFTWGGRFLRPDGAHFEWFGTPRSG
jgi:hypothetical protein